jgi:hypothetical protein
VDLESRRLSSFAILCLWLRQELFAQFDVDVPRDRIPTLAAKAAIIPKFIRNTLGAVVLIQSSRHERNRGFGRHFWRILIFAARPTYDFACLGPRRLR